MEILFSLPHVFSGPASPADPELAHVDNACALRVLLDALIGLNLAYMRFHQCKPLYKAGVRYGRTQEWECIPALYRRRYGDCKSLAAALIAQYRLAGVQADPVFRWVVNDDGGTDYHILVQTNTGFEDPSKVLGMGKDECARFYGPKALSWENRIGYY
jgi:hypothetical protein